MAAVVSAGPSILHHPCHEGQPALGSADLLQQLVADVEVGPHVLHVVEVLEGVDQAQDLGESFEVVCDATDTHAVRLACSTAGLEIESAEIAWLPSLSVPLEDDVAVKVLRLVDALEDLDDVQNVWANFDVSDEVLERVG